jgi:hypothetical protein
LQKGQTVLAIDILVNLDGEQVKFYLGLEKKIEGPSWRKMYFKVKF